MYCIENRTAAHIFLPQMHTRTKPVVKHEAVDGVVVPVEVDKEYPSAAADACILVPPTLKPTEPGMVEVSNAKFDELQKNPAIRGLFDSGQLNGYKL